MITITVKKFTSGNKSNCHLAAILKPLKSLSYEPFKNRFIAAVQQALERSKKSGCIKVGTVLTVLPLYSYIEQLIFLLTTLNGAGTVELHETIIFSCQLMNENVSFLVHYWVLETR